MSVDGQLHVGETQLTKFLSNRPVKSTLTAGFWLNGPWVFINLTIFINYFLSCCVWRARYSNHTSLLVKTNTSIIPMRYVSSRLSIKLPNHAITAQTLSISNRYCITTQSIISISFITRIHSQLCMFGTGLGVDRSLVWLPVWHCYTAIKRSPRYASVTKQYNRYAPQLRK